MGNNLALDDDTKQRQKPTSVALSADDLQLLKHVVARRALRNNNTSISGLISELIDEHRISLEREAKGDERSLHNNATVLDLLLRLPLSTDYSPFVLRSALLLASVSHNPTVQDALEHLIIAVHMDEKERLGIAAQEIKEQLYLENLIVPDKRKAKRSK